jgi:hypothetical protein
MDNLLEDYFDESDPENDDFEYDDDDADCFCD